MTTKLYTNIGLSMLALLAITVGFRAAVNAKEAKEKEKANQSKSTSATPSPTDPPISTTGQPTSTAPPISTTGPSASPAPPISTTGPSTSPAQPTSYKPPWVIGPTPVQQNEDPSGRFSPVDTSSELHPKSRLNAFADSIVITG